MSRSGVCWKSDIPVAAAESSESAERRISWNARRSLRKRGNPVAEAGAAAERAEFAEKVLCALCALCVAPCLPARTTCASRAQIGPRLGRSMDAVTAATVLGNLAIAFSVVVALAFGIVQTRSAARDRKERLALDTIRSFQTRGFAEHVHFLRAQQPPTTMAELYALPDQDQVTFIHFAQEVEMLGLLVADGAIDIELVERTLGDFVVRAWQKYRSVIEDMRKQLGDPYLAEYFQFLASKVEAQMRDAPRAPAAA